MNSFKRIDNEVIHTRLLNAPRELVWDAWTKPEHIKQWWGPNGFTITNKEMKVTPKGSWEFVMHGFGKDYDNHVHYLEVEKPSLLVFRNGDENDPYSFLVYVTFEEHNNNQTLLTMRTVLKSAAILDELDRTVNAIEGGKQTLNRLVEYVHTQFTN